MKKISIIYWSSTGNTEVMAESIYEGIQALKEKELDVVVKYVSKANAEDISEADLVVLGSSAMSVESIDDSEMEPYLKEHQHLFTNKKVALFGSYDWGDGEWLETWAEMMTALGCQLPVEPLKLQNTPDQEGVKLCHDFSKLLFNQLK